MRGDPWGLVASVGRRLGSAVNWALDVHRGLPCAAAVLAALLSIGLGLALGPSAKTNDADRAWRAALQPLAQAPIAPGSRVLFVPPSKVSREESLLWLYEVSWLRPDLLWTLPEYCPLPEGATGGLSVGMKELPSGWRVVWRRGDLWLARYDKGE